MYRDNIGEQDGYFLLLQMQIESLQEEVTEADAMRKKASKRATDSEKRNKVLRQKIESLEGELRTLAQCWNCDKLGDHNACRKCSNNAIFLKEGKRFIWRGDAAGGGTNNGN